MRRALCLACVALLVAMAGCVPGGPDPEACAAPTAEVTLRLDADGLEPGSPAVCRDQEVTLVVESALDGVLHVHGYDSEVPAFQVTAGSTSDVTFAAARSGQFPIEFHPADDPTGVAVGVLTVHEP